MRPSGRYIMVKVIRLPMKTRRKAAMVSNLLVVLVSDKDVTPVVNTGTLYA